MKRILQLLIVLFSATVLQAQDKPVYDIQTYRAGNFLGTISIELFPLIAPLHVANFDSLVGVQFYDSTAFHRVIPGFMIQGGDPNSKNLPKSTWGFGQPWQPTVPAEFNAVPHKRGVLSAARSSNINSATSQFFICVDNAPWLNFQYSGYGRVLSGMAVVDTIVMSPRDANDCPLQKIEMFISLTGYLDTVPPAPSGLIPQHNSSGINASQQFQWLPAYDAVLYDFQLSDDSLFNNIITSSEIADTFFTVNNLMPSTEYFWRLRTNNGGYKSAWTNTHYFQTGLPGPDLLSPANGINNVSLPVQLVWRSRAGADSYKIQIARSLSFPAPSIVLDVDSIADTSFTATTLDPNTDYFWRVQAREGADLGFYSSKFSFRTGTPIGIDEGDHEIQDLIIYPQPADNIVLLDLNLKRSAALEIELYDLAGRILLREHAAFNSGRAILPLNTGQVQSGNYFLRIKSRSGVLTKRLLIAR